MELSCEESVEGLAIARVLAAVLERLVSANQHLSHLEPRPITKFHAMKAPGIGIRPYLERYVKLRKSRGFASFVRVCVCVCLRNPITTESTNTRRVPTNASSFLLSTLID